MIRFAPLILALALCSCATQRRIYKAPDATALKASTERVSKAVDRAHTAARKAQSAVTEASKRAKAVEEETRKIKDLPASVIENMNALKAQLDEAMQQQILLESSLAEADRAKAQVEKDKVALFAGGEQLAKEATIERDKRIQVEKQLSYYRWHSWLFKIGAALAVVGIIVLAFLWLTGRLAGLASKFL